MVPFAEQHSLVFVGASATWYDLHFMALWQALMLRNSHRSHFILCKESEFENQRDRAAGINLLYESDLRVVKFYKEYNDLWTNLETLRVNLNIRPLNKVNLISLIHWRIDSSSMSCFMELVDIYVLK
jgi:hypothetical protein